MLWNREGPSFEPYCEESEDCRDTAHRWTRTTTPHSPHSNSTQPSAGCAASLAKVCGKAAKGTACEACALQQWSTLKAAGCVEAAEVTWCTPPPKPHTWNPPNGVCKCSGSPNVFAWLLPNLEIVDRLRIPAGIAPGHYVLNWRW
jgi:hypothetical protein